jgi:hypothetical protein
MLTREERLEYCNRCIHKKVSERYGTICGLTDNYPHFSEKCDSFQKETQFSFDSIQDMTTTAKLGRKKIDSKKGSWVVKGTIIYIVVKILIKLFKQYL